MVVVEVLAVALVLFGVVVAGSGGGGQLSAARTDDGDDGLPAPGEPVRSDDIPRVRFALALRGYRMSEVDRVLERVRGQLAVYESLLLAAEAAGPPEPAAPGPGPVTDPEGGPAGA